MKILIVLCSVVVCGAAQTAPLGYPYGGLLGYTTLPTPVLGLPVFRSHTRDETRRVVPQLVTRLLPTDVLTQAAPGPTVYVLHHGLPIAPTVVSATSTLTVLKSVEHLQYAPAAVVSVEPSEVATYAAHVTQTVPLRYTRTSFTQAVPTSVLYGADGTQILLRGQQTATVKNAATQVTSTAIPFPVGRDEVTNVVPHAIPLTQIIVPAQTRAAYHTVTQEPAEADTPADTTLLKEKELETYVLTAHAAPIAAPILPVAPAAYSASLPRVASSGHAPAITHPFLAKTLAAAPLPLAYAAPLPLPYDAYPPYDLGGTLVYSGEPQAAEPAGEEAE